MKNIKTYESFFDFFKKKNYDPVSIRHILDCLLPITDSEGDIKSWSKGDVVDGMFVEESQLGGGKSDHDEFLDYIIRDARHADTGGLEIRNNIAYFKMQYAQREWNDGRMLRNGQTWQGISDDEMASIMKECQETLEGFDCKMTFFIGRGVSEGRSWDTEFSDFSKMIEKTVNKMESGKECIRNITVKIEALGGFEN